MFAVDLLGLFHWHSEPGPAAPNEITRLRQQKPELESALSKKEALCADTAFEGVLYDNDTSRLWVIKKNTTLTPEDEAYNYKIEIVRGEIENVGFGRLCNKFSIWLHRWEWEREWFKPILRFTLALHNLMQLMETHHLAALPVQWELPLPQCEVPLKKYSLFWDKVCFL